MSYADDVLPEYLWCKDMRHAWDPDSLVSREVFNRRIERWEVWRTVRCYHCPVHKVQKLTKGFQLLRTDYDYPDNYKVQGGPGYRMTAADWAAIRARNTALRGGTEKPGAADRKAARAASNVTPIRSRRKHA